MSRWVNRLNRVGRDGYLLLEAYLRDRPSTLSVKPLLLDQARESNSVANSILQMDKQIGLVRYYGVMGYFREQLKKKTPVTTTTQAFKSTDVAPSTARIAFMITEKMKQELRETLGYENEEIKQMTPLQASLILHHQIKPESKEERLPTLEQEYQEQKEKEQEERRLQVEQEELRLQKEQFKSSTRKDKAAESSISNDQIVGSLHSNRSSNYMSTNTLLFSSNSSSDGFGNSWFEVVQVNQETNEIIRVGLYQDENEALLGMQTRQEIADEKELPLSFEMNVLEKANVFPERNDQYGR